MNETYLILAKQYYPGYGNASGFISQARKLTDEEMLEFKDCAPQIREEICERRLVSIGERIGIHGSFYDVLDMVGLASGASDGEIGFEKNAWFLSEEQWGKCLQWERNYRIKSLTCVLSWLKKKIGYMEKCELCKTQEEASKKSWIYNETVNQGGFGYVPAFYTVEEYERAKNLLVVLDDEMKQLEDGTSLEELLQKKPGYLNIAPVDFEYLTISGLELNMKLGSK